MEVVTPLRVRVHVCGIVCVGAALQASQCYAGARRARRGAAGLYSNFCSGAQVPGGAVTFQSYASEVGPSMLWRTSCMCIESFKPALKTHALLDLHARPSMSRRHVDTRALFA